jgi:hypothetical protein
MFNILSHKGNANKSKVFFAIKNEIMSFEEKWIEQEMIMLRKITQTEKKITRSHMQKSRP